MPDFPNAAHHIVAGKAPSAEAARQILLEYGVDIDDAANGVFLPTITTTRKTGGLHLAYKARVSSRDLSPQLSLTFKPIAV